MAFIKPGSGRKPKITGITGVADTHMHFYGPLDRYKLAPTRVNDPPAAWVDDYKQLKAWLGIDRTVIVQPSHYGKDNTCTMDAVAGLGRDKARAIVVVDETAPDKELERLTKDGAVGIRFHMMPGGVLPWDILERMAARVNEHGWHVQLQCNGHELPSREALLKRLPGKLVIDHVGRFMDPVPTDHAAFRTLLGLLDRGNCWVKLSAPYESSKRMPPKYEDVEPEAQALARHAPQRMLWATNWPHPGTRPWTPDDADLLDMLLDWIPDDKARQRCLVDNAAELYGFR